MKVFLALLFAILFLPVAFPFSIDSYYTHAAVQADGSLVISESINFTLEKEYSEGFRSVRKEDFGSLSDITIQSVKVNGQAVQYSKQMNGQNAEIVWKKTYAGANNVELRYTIKNRAQIYNDFAKVCFEHYGADWPVSAAKFKSVMTMPEAARGKDMHFEIYSAMEGNAYIDDLSVVVDMADVPSGNYVGGCYLYDKGALTTVNKVNASALQILTDERKAYGSKTIIAAEEQGSSTLCCLPLGLLAAIAALFFFIKDSKMPHLPENILPPGKEEPAVAAVLAMNRIEDSDALSSTILDLINRGCLDIVELEKKGEASAESKREHTILLLKRRPESPKAYETAVLDMLFPEGRKEADLDQMAADYDAIRDKGAAKAAPIAQNIQKFTDEIEKMLRSRGVWEIRNAAVSREGISVMIAMMALFAACATVFVTGDFILNYLAAGNYAEVIGTGLGILLFFPSVAYFIIHNRRPAVPEKFREEFGRWDAFARAVKSSRLSEYPPSSALIWGDILVYAAAMGLADKVKRHMSELDSLTAKRLERLEATRISTRHYFASALAVYNLKTYGNRAGVSRSHGGFSSHSSGGWSSGGGGGFSGGSSGGGGFR